MNLRWLFGNYADPQYDLTRREQHALSTLAHKKYLAPKLFWGWTALIVIPIALAFMFALPLTLNWLGKNGQTGPEIIGVVIVLLSSWPYFGWMYRTLYTRPFRKAMREKGYDICLNCGYNLMGLDETSPRCPECGQRRENCRPDANDLDAKRNQSMSMLRVVPNITTDCLEDSREFYTKLFGVEVAMDMDWIVTLVSPENPVAQISLVQGKRSKSAPQGVTLTIEVADVDDIHTRAITLGYEILYPLTDEPWGVRRFHVQDPNGVVINVMSHLKPAS